MCFPLYRFASDCKHQMASSVTGPDKVEHNVGREGSIPLGVQVCTCVFLCSGSDSSFRRFGVACMCGRRVRVCLVCGVCVCVCVCMR